MKCSQCIRITVNTNFAISINPIKYELGQWCDWCYERVDDLNEKTT